MSGSAAITFCTEGVKSAFPLIGTLKSSSTDLRPSSGSAHR